MALTVVNLSDAISAWVTKTNTIASNVGDLALLTTDSSGSLVAAINEINGQLDRDINDSAEIISLAKSSLASSSTVSFDSSLGKFSVVDSSIGQAQFKSGVTLVIKGSQDSALKTLFAAGA